MEQQITPSRHLRERAGTHFKGYPVVRDALEWARTNPYEMINRAGVLDLAIIHMQDKIFPTLEGLDPDYYRDVVSLKKMLEGKPLYTLRDTSSLAQEPYLPEALKKRVFVAETTFEQIASLIPEGKDWDYVNLLSDEPGKIISALLIEGNGLYLENLHNKEGLAKTFVRAIEVVLLTQYDQSELFEDVKEWMREEVDDFPERVRRDIYNLFPFSSEAI